jgi:phytol kinase
VLHVGMGLTALTFPWVFGADRGAVLVLAAIALVAMVGLRVIRPLRAGLGTPLHGVARTSFGEIFFILSIATVYWLAAGDLVLYFVPVLVLSLADAAGALVGVRYGSRDLSETHEDTKSFEGSFSFFWVAFMSTLVPLLLFTSTGRAETLLVALLIGVLVALIEAVSLYGADNLLIPLGTYAFLSTHLTLPVADLTLQVAVLAVMALAARFTFRKGTTSVTRLGLVLVVLSGYLFAFLGGWRWLVAPATLFFAYSLVPPLTRRERGEPPVEIAIVASNVAVPLLWLFVTRSWGLPGALYPLTVAVACHLALNISTRMLRYFELSPLKAVLVGWGEACLFVLLPGAFLMAGDVLSAKFWAVGGTLAAALLAPVLERRMGCERALDPRRAWIQSAIVLVISLVAALASGALARGV